ncbi:MAG: hypothetical protein WCA44_04935 [Acidobacteriaceae bacterium]
MDSETNLMPFPQRSEEDSLTWHRGVAAGSLVAGALLLVTGYRRAGLAVAAAGATVALLENPEAVRNFWNSIPDLVHTSQDFLSRAESLIDDINRQRARIRNMLSREA